MRYSGVLVVTSGEDGKPCYRCILAGKKITFGLVRWCFNVTLFLAGVFGLAAGGSPNFIVLASLLAVVGVGVGGMPNLGKT